MIEPFGSDMIERFATESQLQYSIDGDGDVRMGFARPGTVADGGGLTVWISSRHEGLLHLYGVLAISDAERADLLEWSNAWNLRNPWPTLRLAEACGGTGRHLVTAAALYPVQFGTTYEAVESMCKIGVMAMHTAWTRFGDWTVDPRTREVAPNTAERPSTAGGTRPGDRATAPWSHDFGPAGAEDPDRLARFN